jgi:twitching motility protein PilT
MDISQLLTFCVQQGGSDLHISAGEPPMIRIDGSMKKMKMPPLTPDQTRDGLYDIMGDAQRAVFEEKNDIDFSIELGTMARFRVNIFNQNRGMGGVFRVIPTKIMTMEELSLPPVLAQIIKKEKGIILVTGPTGSGKSTTLAAMINEINLTSEGHILTIEDPIEFVHNSKKCLINQREVGPHTKSFNNALKAALREDPDIILVGELRDLETIQLALTAAETGHLVFGTLHTSSAPKTMDRIIDVFPANQQGQIRAMLAESMQAIVTQTLCKKIGGGRAAALEILIGNTAVKNLIREGKIHQIPSMMQTNKHIGMCTMEMALIELVNKGLITKETAIEKSGNPDMFKAADMDGANGIGMGA